MPNFTINRDAQQNGNYEVHNTSTGCNWTPAQENLADLGWHIDCHSAIKHARELYPQVQERIVGCPQCCIE